MIKYCEYEYIRKGTPGPLSAVNWKPFRWYGERITSGGEGGPCVANAPT